MTQKERYKAITEYFSENAPNAETELVYSNAYELTIAVILSAQCTDKRVNLTTPALFKAYPNFKTLAKANLDSVFELIKSISYPNNKAKNCIAMAQMVVDKFNGSLPVSFDNLVLLPGVGRKTANVIMSVLYNKPNMAVDTHVFRVSQRIGLVKPTKSFLEVEETLVKNFTKKDIPKAHHWLILHGRYVCVARKPKCDSCGIRDFCKYNETNASNL